MEQEEHRTYFATLGDMELRTWESNGRYPWSVTNSRTGEVIARAEAADRESAMVGAAQFVQAEWGSLRWRRSEGEEEESAEDII